MLALSEALQKGSLALFIGSDLPASLTGTLPRAELARQLAAQHHLIPHAEAHLAYSLAGVAHRIQSVQAVRNFLSAAQPQAPAAFHRKIAAFIQHHAAHLPYILTTAYDHCLLQALNEQGVACHQVFYDEHVPGIEADRPTLLYLHGCIADYASLVVADFEHARLRHERRDVWGEVRQVLQKHTLLFIGYDLSDHDFIDLYADISRNQQARPLYVVWPGLTEAEKANWRAKNVVILEVIPPEFIADLAVPVVPQVVTTPPVQAGKILPENFDLQPQLNDCENRLRLRSHGLVGLAVPCGNNEVLQNLGRQLKTRLRRTRAQLREAKQLTPTVALVETAVREVLEEYLPAVNDGDVIFGVQVVEPLYVQRFWEALSAALREQHLVHRLIVILPVPPQWAELPAPLQPPLPPPQFGYAETKRWVEDILPAAHYPTELIDEWVELICCECQLPADPQGALDPAQVYRHIRDVMQALCAAAEANVYRIQQILNERRRVYVQTHP